MVYRIDQKSAMEFFGDILATYFIFECDDAECADVRDVLCLMLQNPLMRERAINLLPFKPDEDCLSERIQGITEKVLNEGWSALNNSELASVLRSVAVLSHVHNELEASELERVITEISSQDGGEEIALLLRKGMVEEEQNKLVVNASHHCGFASKASILRSSHRGRAR